jgi:MATE family multidrug resistance protein
MATSTSLSAPRVAASAGGVREVTLLAYPIVLSQLSQTLMHVVDSIIVGRLGAAELAALGFASVWLWTVMSVFTGTATGVQTFVSQAQGAADERACGRWTWHALYAVVPAATLTAFAFAAAAPSLWSGLGASAEIREQAMAYTEMRPIGLAGQSLWIVLVGFFRGIGDTRTPLVATLVANAANAVLDYGLVLGRLGLPAWGVAGAGAATSISEWIGVLIIAVAFLGPRMRERYGTLPLRPDLAAIRRFLRTGAPVGGQWLLDMSTFAIFTTLVAGMGDAPMAATQVMISLLSLSFMQAIGIGLAATTLVGRYKGAGDLPAAVRSYHSATKLALVLALCVAAIFVLAPDALMRLFSSDPEVLLLGPPLLALAAAFQLFDAVQIVAGCALQGAGDTRWPFLVQTGLAWLLRLPLAWLFAVTLEGGVVGAWYAEFVLVVSLAVALVLRFRSGKWVRLQI